MRQLPNDRQVIYIDDTALPALPAHYDPAEVVYVLRRRPAPPRRIPWGVIMFLPFWLGIIATIALVFALDDIDWLIRRMAAALALLFMFGTVGSVVGGMWMAIRDMFTRDSWRDYE